MQPPPRLLIIHSAGDRDAGGERGTHNPHPPVYQLFTQQENGTWGENKVRNPHPVY